MLDGVAVWHYGSDSEEGVNSGEKHASSEAEGDENDALMRDTEELQEASEPEMEEEEEEAQAVDKPEPEPDSEKEPIPPRSAGRARRGTVLSTSTPKAKVKSKAKVETRPTSTVAQDTKAKTTIPMRVTRATRGKKYEFDIEGSD